MTIETIADVAALGRAIAGEAAKAVIGQESAIELITIAVLAGGHCLLEGPPGTAKTLLAGSVARAVGLEFGRIQFTPDLMPGDILGTNLFNFQTSSFTFTRGPLFTQLLLADEINRTPPKTQAALLEAMQERQVTAAGEVHPLSPHFTVLATQNPIENQGVYPLPEAQLDRFLFKVLITHPDADAERRIVAEHGRRFASSARADYGIVPVASAADLAAASALIAGVRLADDIVDYIVRLVRATRTSAELDFGASPRAATMLARAAAALAALSGRDYVIPDDVKALAAPALGHRIILSPMAEIEGRDAAGILAELVAATEVPR